MKTQPGTRASVKSGGEVERRNWIGASCRRARGRALERKGGWGAPRGIQKVAFSVLYRLQSEVGEG